MKDGYIKNSDSVVNGRARKEYSAKSVKELIKWDEMKSKPDDYNF